MLISSQLSSGCRVCLGCAINGLQNNSHMQARDLKGRGYQKSSRLVLRASVCAVRLLSEVRSSMRSMIVVNLLSEVVGSPLVRHFRDSHEYNCEKDYTQY
jgi:hypothetical protein